MLVINNKEKILDVVRIKLIWSLNFFFFIERCYYWGLLCFCEFIWRGRWRGFVLNFFIKLLKLIY